MSESRFEMSHQRLKAFDVIDLSANQTSDMENRWNNNSSYETSGQHKQDHESKGLDGIHYAN
ncbi:hypothetical protein Syun_027253 [Stephania yunnanensis]|uniref:Uncharacterized protein n=1 Tax=Stephania yunnanensis TaxID=152371 RepID=A0AAP0EKD1_9MAGN